MAQDQDTAAAQEWDYLKAAGEELPPRLGRALKEAPGARVKFVDLGNNRWVSRIALSSDFCVYGIRLHSSAVAAEFELLLWLKGHGLDFEAYVQKVDITHG